MIVACHRKALRRRNIGLGNANLEQTFSRTRLGRRNTKFIEVLDGLEPGENVITSPYTSFVGMDRLNLGE